MKFILKPLFLLIVFSLYQCNSAPEQKPFIKKEKGIDIKKQEEKKIVKSWDSLNRFNAEAFLRAYGKENPETKVIIKTKFGDIKLRLYKDVPVHRANFIFLTKIKYFNTTEIYRVAKNFVIQGGNSDNLYTQKQRRKYGNYLLEPEFRKNRKHKYGA